MSLARKSNKDPKYIYTRRAEIRLLNNAKGTIIQRLA